MSFLLKKPFKIKKSLLCKSTFSNMLCNLIIIIFLIIFTTNTKLVLKGFICILVIYIWILGSRWYSLVRSLNIYMRILSLFNFRQLSKFFRIHLSPVSFKLKLPLLFRRFLFFFLCFAFKESKFLISSMTNFSFRFTLI